MNSGAKRRLIIKHTDRAGHFKPAISIFILTLQKSAK
jgi:hypothetical protein